jgi:hypothetical protein
LTQQAVQAGAFGFTTSRTNAHKTTQGEMVPGRFAEIEELAGIGGGLGALGAGAFGMNSDFEDEASEFQWITRLGLETRRPLWFLPTGRPIRSAGGGSRPASARPALPALRSRRRSLGDRSA